MRVGGLSARPIDVRFVAATNRDLEAEIAPSASAQDLYFRAQRHHADSSRRCASAWRRSPPLARRFLAQGAAAAGRRPPRLAPEALERLCAYAWPGNIRELRNVIERALVLCDGDEITLEHLPLDKMRIERASSPAEDAFAAPLSAAAAPDRAGESEQARILRVMADNGWNQTKAARQLGMARGTLIERLERFGIKRPQDRPARGRV